ncbi:MAG: ABC transporter substrate-binding protein, partial [Janthinobacterium lividum]
MSRRPSILLAAILGLAAVTAPAARAESTLVVCTEASPDALNPQLSSANTSFDVGEQISDRLVEMRTGGSELRPGLAEAWDVAPDGLRVTFHLRGGVAWQSNAHFQPTRALDAEDVVFSFRRMMDHDDPFYRSANGTFPEFQVLLQSSLLAVDKVDERTVAFTLKAPLAPLPALLTMQPMGIVSAEYAATALKAGHPEWLDQEPIGTGPFAFQRYAKDSQVRFRAFPGFWGRAGGQADRVAAVDNLVFSI